MDYFDYTNQLLFSYRALTQELYKCQYNLKFFEVVKHDTELPAEIKIDYVNRSLRYLLNVKGLLFLKRHMEDELFRGKKTRSFRFKTIRLPRIDVCACDVFNEAQKVRMWPKDVKNIDPDSDKFPYRPNFNFINIIPEDNDSYFITGHFKAGMPLGRLYFLVLSLVSRQELLRMISFILITRIESWCISHTFYRKLKEMGRDEAILTIKDAYRPTHMKKKKMNFNMFKGVVK